MKQLPLQELVKAANPVPAPERLLHREADLEALFDVVSSRVLGRQEPSVRPDAAAVEASGTQNVEQPTRGHRAPERRGAVRWWRPAIAGAAIALIATLVVIPLARDDGMSPLIDDAPRTALEVVEALNSATLEGDIAGIRSLYSDDPIWIQGWANDTSVRLLEPSFAPFPDWDGDGAVTLFEELLHDRAADYASGVTLGYTCAETSPSTVVCDGVFEGHAFLSETSELRVTNTFTVADGLITQQRFNAAGGMTFATYLNEKLDPDLVGEYRDWADANRPETQEIFDGFIFDFFGIAPANYRAHRDLIAEWVAER